MAQAKKPDDDQDSGNSLIRTLESKANVELTPSDDEFSEYANAGMENIGARDLMVPRLSIIQKLSYELDPKDGRYIPDAKEGDIYDAATGDLFPDGVVFLPCHYAMSWIQWAPRSSGRGLVEIHKDDGILTKTTLNERRKPMLPNGDYIAETAQFYGFNLTAGGRRSFIPMTSTQLKKARKWNMLSTGERVKRADGSEFTPPLFYRSYMLTTVDESNTDGRWKGWKIERGEKLSDLGAIMGFDWRSMKDQAVEFYEQLLKDEVRGDLSGLGEESRVVDPTEAPM
jgi:hypothetical protein